MTAEKSAIYRGATREEAERVYHAEARAGAENGWVPASEDWSMALGQQVLTVRYVYSPAQASGVLEAIAGVERDALRPSPVPSAIQPGGSALPPPPAVTVPSTKRSPVYYLVGLVAVLLIGYGIYTIIGNPFAGIGPASPGVGADVPPVGQIWFGTSFDTSTFAVRGRTASVTSGATVAMVAQLPRSITSGEANLRVALDGQTINNQALTINGSGELFGATYTVPVPGTYVFTITDLGGNTLATGSLTAK